MHPREQVQKVSDQANLFDAVEEYDGNQGLGVEAESSDTFHDIDRPWNPESIRVTTKSFSLRNMLDAIEETPWISPQISNDYAYGASYRRTERRKRSRPGKKPSLAARSTRKFT